MRTTPATAPTNASTNATTNAPSNTATAATSAALRNSALGSASLALAPASAPNTQFNTPPPSTVLRLSPQAQGRAAPEPSVYTQPTAANPTSRNASAPRIDLRLETASGLSVQLTLDPAAPWDASAPLQTQGGSLSEAEQTDLAQIASGWQRALQGMVQNPPNLDFSSLAAMGSGANGGLNISRLDISASLPVAQGSPPLAFSYHQDAQTRSLDIRAPQGSIHIAVPTPAVPTPASGLGGTPAQKEQALDGYLQRITAAARKGHADPALTQLFRSSLSALLISDNAAPTANPSSSQPLFSPLPDFDASFQTTSANSTFSYRLQQSTTFSNAADTHPLSASQTQHSQLQANLPRSPAPHSTSYPTSYPTSNSSRVHLDYSFQTTLQLFPSTDSADTAALSANLSATLRIQIHTFGQSTTDLRAALSSANLPSSADLRALLAGWEDALFASDEKAGVAPSV